MSVTDGGHHIEAAPRQHTSSVGELRPGVYFVDQQCPDVDLIPVQLRNLGRILPKGELLPVPILGSATFGAPMQLAPGRTAMPSLTRRVPPQSILVNANELGLGPGNADTARRHRRRQPDGGATLVGDTLHTLGQWSHRAAGVRWGSAAGR